jgi:putative hydrolase of the HAD superfamily
LQSFFEAIEIVSEKDCATYSRAVEQFRIVKAAGWMIGNSPRSDINPAIEAGLNAVFIPHPDTWELEHSELRSGGGKIVIVQNFRELRNHF